MQAELEQMARGRGRPHTNAIQQAGLLAFERFDWERGVDAAVCAARALALGHRLSEGDSNYALSPLRHIVEIPEYADLV